MIARVFMSLVVLFSIILWAGYFYLGSAAKAGIECRRRIGVNDRGERRLALAITTQRKKPAFEAYR